jgi:hypothetical protein
MPLELWFWAQNGLNDAGWGRLDHFGWTTGTPEANNRLWVLNSGGGCPRIWWPTQLKIKTVPLPVLTVALIA